MNAPAGDQRARVLALPGLLCDRWIWEPQIEGLADLAEVVVPDFSALDSLTDMARTALALVDAPPVRSGPVLERTDPPSTGDGGGLLDVVGHSMGARVAFEVWRLAPERVRSLVVLDTGTHPLGPAEPATRKRLLDVSAQQGMRALADAWLPPMVHPDRRGDAAFMAPLVEMVMRATPEQHARQIRALLQRPDARPLLGTITVPTLVIVGRQDEWSPVAQHEAIVDAVATANLEIVEDSGHMVTVEQPDAVTELLRSWLLDLSTEHSR